MTRPQRTLIVAGAVAAIVIAANASHGAYFSQSWGWVALAFLVPTTVLLILDRVSVPGRLRVVFATLMGALGLWIALSTIWSISPSGSAREVERVLVYVSLALALALILRRGDAPAVAGGALVGAVAISSYGLATRLVPDRFESFDDPFNTYRLAEPIGYWNASGLLATMGVLLGLGVAGHARRSAWALAAGAALPVLVVTLYFTFSRGAWAALMVGGVAAVALDPRRLRLLWTIVVLATPSAACVAYGSRLETLTTEDGLASAASTEGHRMAVVVAVAVLASTAAAGLARIVANRVVPSAGSRRIVDLGVAALGVAAIAIGLAAAGGPRSAWGEFESRFATERFATEPVAGADLNDRLFTVSGNGRAEQLRVGWNAGRDRPVLGQGAGTYEYVFYAQRSPVLQVVRDGHSLYMETFAELGIVGLALLGGALITPVVAAIRSRRSRFVAVGCGAYVSWMAASAFDWHWEMVGVTATALLVGSVGLVSAERRRTGRLQPSSRLALIGVTGTLSVLAVWSLVGNQALFAARDAIARKEWSEARDHARRAQALLPWSHEPDLALGASAAGLGDREGALAAYRDAVEIDPRNWVAWLRLAQVARGAERDAANDRVRELNPADPSPGE